MDPELDFMDIVSGPALQDMLPGSRSDGRSLNALVERAGFSLADFCSSKYPAWINTFYVFPNVNVEANQTEQVQNRFTVMPESSLSSVKASVHSEIDSCVADSVLQLESLIMKDVLSGDQAQKSPSYRLTSKELRQQFRHEQDLLRGSTDALLRDTLPDSVTVLKLSKHNGSGSAQKLHKSDMND
eukprot:CAMPEP_0185609512 /NCGR_PEP_ID=MMETSP0436-20130131/9798_1 /TAXON_ID=626734 ORGANISM="Favella taraikaensis, Strain Fe Narragansett Bay" /NCGR_SAMPLE_ID=MMETSP0436 /ASSEMBLY_ACC=CAM_ASM_000390 /LENGTH=184 /DNA_ID=CAMNT_0028241935 /DNA_START=127 /DNA_END=678 /DNA_ORIENTATION=+